MGSPLPLWGTSFHSGASLRPPPEGSKRLTENRRAEGWHRAGTNWWPSTSQVSFSLGRQGHISLLLTLACSELHTGSKVLLAP